MPDSYISPINAKPKKQRFSTYDLEWYPHSLELRLAGVYDGKKYRDYRRITDFLNGELTSQNKDRWFYAHAGGMADLQFILEEIVKRANSNVKVKGAFSGSSCIMAKISKFSGRYKTRKLKNEVVREPIYNSWYLVDSLWLIRQSLAKIGQWIGREKGGDHQARKTICPIPRILRECKAQGKDISSIPMLPSGQYLQCTCDSTFFAPYNELKDYNREDNIILHIAISHFEKVLLSLGGQLEKTVASCALGLFRRKFLKTRIPTWDSVNDDARGAYIASRVEVLRKELTEEANYYDINSSFPFAMAHHQGAPGALKKTVKYKPDSGIYMSKATIEVSDNEWLPPLGYRSKSGRLFFPTGKWTQWFSNVDLELLEDSGGRIEKIHSTQVFEQFYELKDYAQTIYDLRNQSSEEYHRQPYKILLNSLYGKFAEREEKQSILVNPESTKCPHADKNGNPLHPSDGIPGSCFQYVSAGLWMFEDIKRPPHQHVPIAAHITALARRELYRYLLSCSPNVYYCDTDGFCTTESCITGKQLGGLKLEKTLTPDNAGIAGKFEAPKLVAYHTAEGGWTVKAKGFRSLTYTEFISLLEGNEVEREHMLRIRESMRKGDFKPQEKTVLKAYRGTTKPKRCYIGDNSRPWNIEEIKEE